MPSKSRADLNGGNFLVSLVWSRRDPTI